MRFKLTGKSPRKCSREFVRAWLHASACVLAYHGKILPRRIDVRLVDHIEDDVSGRWNARERRILIQRTMTREGTATTILHEVIHAACGNFGNDTDEKCCSTLTAKLKPEVQQLAQPLIDGTYRRAAYIAHTKLSYVVEDDYYDDDQWGRVGTKDPYRRTGS